MMPLIFFTCPVTISYNQLQFSPDVADYQRFPLDCIIPVKMLSFGKNRFSTAVSKTPAVVRMRPHACRTRGVYFFNRRISKNTL